VIGNGDILTWRDAQRRREETGCAAVMIGRWALAKPWIFREHAEARDLEMSSQERLSVLRRYVELCRELFGHDDKGTVRVKRFLVFHQDFFRRYRRSADAIATNSEDPAEWGEAPVDELEEWLCRGDVAAVEALTRWLVEGAEPVPPPPPEPDARRAVELASLG